MTVAELKAHNPSRTNAVFKHILVATDFSEASRRALCGALTLATDRDTQVSVIHVMRPDWRYASLENPPEIDLQRIDTEERLKAFVSDAAPATKITTASVRQASVRQAPVAEAVAAVIKEGGIDLLGRRNARARRPKQTGTRFGGGGTPACRTVPGPDYWSRTEPGSDHSRARISPNSIRNRLRQRLGEGVTSRFVPGESASGQADSPPYDFAHARNNRKPSAYAPAVAAADELQEWESASRKRGLQQLRDAAGKPWSGARTRVPSGNRVRLGGDPDSGR